MSEPQQTPLAPHQTLLKPGDVVDGRYRIEAYLGGGGMASVYRATHVVLEQSVAIKIVSAVVREVPGIAQRFIREARAATQLKGAHVARVHDVGTMPDGAPYMVMEYLEGKDLGEVLEQGKKCSVDEAVDFVLQACEALAEVHGLGIVHRDLKPANLFLTVGADGLPCVKLIDFGISRVDSPLSPKDGFVLTHPEAVMGSPRYMSPEQMESATKADVRSDIWGLGAVLYELLVGDAPYDGETVLDIYAATMKGPPPAPSTVRKDVPRGLDEVILKCLTADPAQRHADVAELALALAPFAGDAGRTRAEGIARVLDASRGRAPGALPDEVDGVGERSRVRAKVRDTKKKTSLAVSIAAFALCFAFLGTLGYVAHRASAPDTAAAASTAPPEPAEPPTTTVEALPAAKPAATGTSTATPTQAQVRHRQPTRTNVTPPPPPPPAPPPPPPPPAPTSLFEERK